MQLFTGLTRGWWFRGCGLSLCILFFAHASAQSPVVIRAVDYGVKANSHQNAAPALQRALEACRQYASSVLVLPPGRIDVWPEGAAARELYISNCTENDSLSKIKHIAFLLEDHNNLTIDGKGSLIMLHGKMISFALLKSHNIRIQNIAFDYERPTMSELKMIRVSENRIEARMHPDSRFTIDNGKLVFYGEGWETRKFHTILFDALADQLRYSTAAPLMEAKARQTAVNTVVFEGMFKKELYKAGDILTIRDPYRDNCGGFIEQSRDVVLYDVRMHYMHGLGIVSQFAENITLRRVTVAPRPGSGRIIAAFADCFHFSGCRGKVIIDSCRTSGSHDDPVNVHGTHLQITGINAGGKLTVRFMHHQTYGFPAFFKNDSIAFINPQTLLPQGAAVLRSARLINSREMELELKGALPEGIKRGSCIENLTWTPEVRITNSSFERTNTRGILVTSRRKVVIENNRFYHTGMAPILIADDAGNWFESGPVTDVTIRNNRFEECGYNGSGAITIAPENHQLVAGKYVHHNIRITGNLFKSINGEVLSARSVEGLQFSGNVISTTPGAGATIRLTACNNVTVLRNKLTAAGLSQVIIKGMSPDAIKTDGKLINQ
ncbi:right-handed parallel beta-helix repeat-containing protein [Niabella soli]|uniref:right-handed parallel beta-helix repeat-containing protein n=1 Tax=Niabella soli TaxID=446683 RepID=UPI00024995C4|nr:right-handed parallel beta-helix repeat-containing protein [Niabella soli]